MEKKCGFSGVCAESAAAHYWWSDECDRKSDDDSYTCTTCCQGALCNAAPAPAHRASIAVPLSLALLCYLSNFINKSFTSCAGVCLEAIFLTIFLKTLKKKIPKIIDPMKITISYNLTILQSYNLTIF